MSELQLRAVVADRHLDVEFSVSAGEVLAVLGPNGAGKSTALHVIAGLVRPDDGVRAVGGSGVDRHRGRGECGDARPPGGPALAGPVAVPAHERCRERGLRTTQSSEGVRLRSLRQQSDGAALATRGGRRALRRPKTAATVRGSSPAGGDRARVGGRTRRVVARRTTGRARRRRGRGHPRRAAHRGYPHRLCGSSDHPRPAGRVHARRSGRCSNRKISEIGPVADVLTAPRSHFGARIAGINLINGTIGPDGSLHARSGARWHGAPARSRTTSSPQGKTRSRCSRLRLWRCIESTRTAARAIRLR